MAQYQVAFYLHVEADDDKSAIATFLNVMDQGDLDPALFITKREQEPSKIHAINEEQLDELLEQKIKPEDLQIMTLNNEFIV